MRIAIMQPYLFAYLGYYQLIAAVDRYILDDDVQYINRGWINRNRILFDGKPRTFTFSVQKAPYTLKIKERFFSEEHHLREKKEFLKTLSFWYGRAPHYKDVSETIARIVGFPDTNVAGFVINSVREICRYLDISTPIDVASQFNYDSDLKKQDHTIHICRKYKADEYVNAIGGTELYSKEKFAQEGIALHFLQTRGVVYPQFRGEFVPNLSVIDVMMFNSKEKIGDLLTQYDLV